MTTSSVPSCGRGFESPEDFNTQLSDFLVEANARKMRVLGSTPGDRVATDRAAMLPLPPVPPEQVAHVAAAAPRPIRPARFQRLLRAPGPWWVVGSVHADPTRVGVTCEGAIVADHARVWAQHHTITDFKHAVAVKHLRHGRADLHTRNPATCVPKH